MRTTLKAEASTGASGANTDSILSLRELRLLLLNTFCRHSQPQPSAEGNLELRQVTAAQVAKWFAHQAGGHRGDRTFCERRVQQPGLAPESNLEFSRTQRITNGGHGDDDQVLGRVGRIGNDGWPEFDPRLVREREGQ